MYNHDCSHKTKRIQRKKTVDGGSLQVSITWTVMQVEMMDGREAAAPKTYNFFVSIETFSAT